MSRMLRAQKLEWHSFAPFGDVIETEGAQHYTINDGWAERYHDLAKLKLTQQGGKPAISIFRAKPRPVPCSVLPGNRGCSEPSPPAFAFPSRPIPCRSQQLSQSRLERSPDRPVSYIEKPAL